MRVQIVGAPEGFTLGQLIEMIVNGGGAAEIAPEATPAEEPQVKEVRSEDFHVSIDNVVEGLASRNDLGEVQAIVVVTLGSGGNIEVASSEGTPLTLNLLAQGIKVVDGTYDAADDD